MSQAIVVCCDKRDEVLLPRLIDNLASIYPNSSVFIAPCSINPPIISLPMVSSLRWKTEWITQDILKAMYETGADRVAKIDADTWHIRPYLFEESSSLLGIQWLTRPGFILGIGYSMTRSAILELMLQEPCASCRKTEEDQHLIWLARKKFPNSIKILPIGTARKASTYAGQSDTCVIHLGCDEDRSTRIIYQDKLAEMKL